MRHVACLAILLLALVGGLILWSRAQRPPSEPPAPTPPRAQNAPESPASQRITIYLARELPRGTQGEFVLSPVEREVAATAAPTMASLEALAAGPTPAEESEGFRATLPEGTRVLGVEREGGVVTANFSRELRDNFNGGADWEEIVLYSIVNTLTELEGVDSVRLTVEGAPIESIGGHLSAEEPLRRNSEIVVRGKRGE